MKRSDQLDDPGRLARAGIAALLALAAISSLRKGKRVRGLLAGVGAVAVGYQVQQESEGLSETLDIASTDGADAADAADHERDFSCAACGEPIRLGQGRGPNENDEIVHDACLSAV